MFITFLESLSKIKIALIGAVEENGDQKINTVIFGKSFYGDVVLYKKTFFTRLRLKERKILLLEEKIYKNGELNSGEKEILLQEIENKLLRIQFLREAYNIEAHKIDSNIQVSSITHIDFYNKNFFGLSQKDIGEKFNIQNSANFEDIYSKKILQELISYSNQILPDLVFKFGKYSNFSHNSGIIKIPNQKYYNIQNIITLFFHEVTHFLRTYNGKRNLGFAYQFSGYLSLEEGIALYNEYLYGNKIINYGKFIPYYNACLSVLAKGLSEEMKKQKVYEILSQKGFSKERSLQYYDRFYKYSNIGSSQLFLKDLTYHKGYKNVTKIISRNPKSYDLIMAGVIGIDELSSSIINGKNNYNYSKYFKLMTKKIKASLK